MGKIDIKEALKTERVFQLIGIAIVLAIWAKLTGKKKLFITFLLALIVAFLFEAINNIMGELSQ